MQISAALAALLFLTSCVSEERVEEPFFPDNSRDEYLLSMERLGLLETAMGSEWERSGNPQNNEPPFSLLPLSEIRLFDPARPDAAWYLFEGVRGQYITIDIERDSEAGYFADLFGLPDGYHPLDEESPVWEEISFRPVASGSPEAGGFTRPAILRNSSIRFEPQRSRFYLLRIQPRLLEGGRFEVQIRSEASLAWPVEGTTHEDIISVFGDSRDAGRRVHHGIDIIAPRGRGLVAVDVTRVMRVGERDRGGNTVSLMDDFRQLMYYYAHLDEYAELEQGQQIETGTAVGTVGNTGNAFGGPYHLHIGIYDRSWRTPLDPWYFFVSPAESASAQAAGDQPAIVADADFQPGQHYRLDPAARLYFQPGGRSSLPRSPSIRDHRGELLGALEYPVEEKTWQEEIDISELGGEAQQGLMLAAIRPDAWGFLGDDRIMLWLPRGQEKLPGTPLPVQDAGNGGAADPG